MKRILRTMAVTGITMGAAVLAAPSAMADINFYTVEKAYVGHNGPTYVSEKGPGDLMYTDIVRSPKAAPVIGNKPVKTGDITTKLHGGHHNTAATGVEGAEEEATKVALAKAAEEHGAPHHQAAPHQEAAPQQESLQAAPEQDAQQAAPQQDAQQNAPEQDAQQAAPEQDAQQAAPEQGAEQDAQQQDAQQQDAQQQDAQQAAPQQEAQQNAPEQQDEGYAPQMAQRRATKPEPKPEPKSAPKSVDIHAVKKAAVGQNGDVLVAEHGPGDAVFTNLTKSPHSLVLAGNSATVTGDINSHIRGGKRNTVINAVEGPEQETNK